MPKNKRASANDRATLLRTIINVREVTREKAIDKAIECARIARETGSEKHLREAIRQRDFAEDLTKGIKRNQKELDELTAVLTSPV